MSRKGKRRRRQKAEVTTSDAQLNLLEATSLAAVGKRVADDFARTHAITGTSAPHSLSSEIEDLAAEMLTPAVARTGPIETSLAEADEEATTSSSEAEEVAGRSEKYAETAWAIADKHFGWLLSQSWAFLPLIVWIVIVAFMIVYDNDKQLLSSVRGRVAFLVKSTLPLSFCLPVYFPIFWLKKDWGWVKKACWSVVVACFVAGSCLIWLHPSTSGAPLTPPDAAAGTQDTVSGTNRPKGGS